MAVIEITSVVQKRPDGGVAARPEGSQILYTWDSAGKLVLEVSGEVTVPEDTDKFGYSLDSVEVSFNGKGNVLDYRGASWRVETPGETPLILAPGDLTILAVAAINKDDKSDPTGGTFETIYFKISQVFTIQVDPEPPSLTIIFPQPGVQLETIEIPEQGWDVKVIVTADDNIGISRVEARVDDQTTYFPLKREDGKWVMGNSPPPKVQWTPNTRRIYVRAYDLADNNTEEFVEFQGHDFSKPSLTVDAPIEDQVFVTRDLPYTVSFEGIASDTQSGIQSVGYFVSGQPKVVVPLDASGRWHFELEVTAYSIYTLVMVAMDKSLPKANEYEVRRQFEVKSSIKPESIEELLSPRAYLQELLRFAGSNITTDGTSRVSPSQLQENFFQQFGKLAQFDTQGANDAVNDLLTPVRIIRDNTTPESTGLIARYSFAEAHSGTAELQERGGRFAVNGQYVGATSAMDDPAFAGAISIDRDHYATVEQNTSKLAVGKNNADFSVSFWIYIQGRGNGNPWWSAILFKGNPEVNPGQLSRTFAMWLMPESNKVHFRIATRGKDGVLNGNDGGNSNTSLALGRWTHLAYVKVGRLLQLYIDGRLDAEVKLSGDVIANEQPLLIGRASGAYATGFIGALDELRIYAVALDAEDVRQLALDRHAGLTESPIVDYHRTAYEALLAGLGTSFEEIRTLNLMPRDQRKALAKRLGLWLGEVDGDVLDSLLSLDAYPPPGTDSYELWLANRFGLPMTVKSEKPIVPSYVLAMRQIALTRQWGREDEKYLEPDLDPDLVEEADLSLKAESWISILRARRAELTAKHSGFVTSSSVGDAVLQVFSAAEQGKLLLLETRDANGEDIAVELLELRLDRPMFRRLVGYLKLIASRAPFSTHERDDLAHLLLQAWKKRQRSAAWRNEELQMGPQKLWPNYFSRFIEPAAEPAWVPDNFKSSFLPWRGNTEARSNLVVRITGRLGAWHDLVNTQVQAVSDAQRAALPMLRDGLLGLSDLPGASQRMDGLAARWLMDFATTGVAQLTPIDQATISLQTLINGVRGRWFDVGHPAAKWQYPGQKDLPGNAVEMEFDAQWSWLDNYGRWQAAVLNFLYPENVLFPELKDPKENSKNLNALFDAINAAQPFSVSTLTSPEFTKLREAVPKDRDPPSNEYYFAQVAIALALQRAGRYTAALDEYRQVYDTSQARPETRKLVPPLSGERDDLPPLADFGDAKWATLLEDPHRIAQAGKSGCRNPYTRFTLFQILHCVLGQADDAFASGTLDGRARALALFLEANDILNFDELRDIQPSNPLEAYLPSPVLASLRAHATSALSKMRRGLSYLGTPLPPDLTRGKGGGAVSSLVRPTPYRYRILMDRAKQLTSQAQQLEAQYLSAIEHGDAEAEKYLASGFALNTAEQTVALKSLQETEASDGQLLAQDQQGRSAIQAARYQQWIDAGTTQNEKSQVDNLWAARNAKDVIAVADAAITIATALAVSYDVGKEALSFGGAAVSGAAIGVAATTRGVAQGFLNYNETQSQVSGILASQERRLEEWQLQRDLANQDVKIGAQQLALTQDRIAITTQESLIATSQRDNAKQMLAFLGKKFTSVSFYQWLVGELAQTYATFLRLATVTAQHAELQIAFERQEQPARLIKADYWLAASNAAASASNSTGTGSGLDPRGITGSARLLQDLYTLDERAFSSERRLLNLSQSFSLARLMPVEFENFRRTGLLSFSTPMSWFDEGFPGHYMRLVKKIRLSVAALVPPSVGIRATFANGGLSRVVTSDAGYPTMVIRQDPQLVALTSPMASTGVFELDTQADLLYPFEGTAVDTTWHLELPPAGNLFDFQSLIDVVLSIDYTAQFSPELRDRVVKKMPRQFSGDRSFSIKRDLPDAWYEIANGTGDSVTFTLPISRSRFPPGLTQVQVTEVSLSARSTDAMPCAFTARLVLTLPDKTKRASDAALSIGGVASSRRAGGAGWHRSAQGVNVIDEMPALTDANVSWAFVISNQASNSPGSPPLVLEQLRGGLVDDFIVVMTFSGVRPAWA